MSSVHSPGPSAFPLGMAHCAHHRSLRPFATPESCAALGWSPGPCKVCKRANTAVPISSLSFRTLQESQGWGMSPDPIAGSTQATDTQTTWKAQWRQPTAPCLQDPKPSPVGPTEKLRNELFLTTSKAKGPPPVITGLCDQIRQYYISLFIAAPKLGPRDTAKQCGTYPASLPLTQEPHPKPVITPAQKHHLTLLSTHSQSREGTQPLPGQSVPWVAEAAWNCMLQISSGDSPQCFLPGLGHRGGLLQGQPRSSTCEVPSSPPRNSSQTFFCTQLASAGTVSLHHLPVLTVFTK